MCKCKFIVVHFLICIHFYGTLSAASYYYNMAPSVKTAVLNHSRLTFFDGDTIGYDFNNDGEIEDPLEIVRIIGMDTPEHISAYVSEGQEPIATEVRQAIETVVFKANETMLKCLESRDKYGRNLCHLYVNNEPIALIAVRNGWAYETVSRYGFQGFVIEGQSIFDAAQKVTPSFENPRVWRKKHRVSKGGFEG